MPLERYDWRNVPTALRHVAPRNITPALPLVIVSEYREQCQSACCRDAQTGERLRYDTRVLEHREPVHATDLRGWECIPNVECCECHETFPVTSCRPFGDDETVCDGCAEEGGSIEVCSSCYVARDTDDMREGPDQGWYCDGCADGFGSCEGCDAVRWNDNLRYSEHRSATYCESCSWTCDDCGGAFSQSRDNENVVGDETLCQSCYESSGAFNCDGCGNNYPEGNYGGSTNDGSFCDSCYREGEEPEPYVAPVQTGSRRGSYADPLPIVPQEGDVPTVPNGRTFGVEVECLLGGTPQGWDRHADGSLSQPNGEWEVVSPIHSGTLGIRRVWGALAAMRAAGSKGCASGGVHVHCGVKDLTLGQLANVFDNWEAWGEDTFSGFVPGFRWRSRWCASIKGAGFASHIRRDFEGKLSETVEQHRQSYLTGTSDRYWSLNPLAIARHSTVECRIFPSDCDPARVASWAALVVRFVDVARDLDATRVRQLCERFGAYRVGVRILSRNCAFLSTFLRAEWERLEGEGAHSTDFESHPESDPWGKRRKAERKAKGERKAPKAPKAPAPVGTPFYVDSDAARARVTAANAAAPDGYATPVRTSDAIMERITAEDAATSADCECSSCVAYREQRAAADTVRAAGMGV